MTNIKSKITQLNPDCVHIQIAPEHFPMTGSALNKYGFIFEDAVKRDTNLSLRLTWTDQDAGTLNVEDEKGGTLLKLSKTAFAAEGALAEFDLFDDSEDWIGFGDQTRERLFHRGHKINCFVSNVSSYIPVPFFMSTRGYAILVNTTYQTVFDMGCEDKGHFCWFDKSGQLDFYVWRGTDFKSLLNTYTLLTGRPELPPKWSFGLWYICRTQANDAEVLSDARLFREYNIPCDVIGLEPGWMDTIYDFTPDKDWSKERFPLPAWQKECLHTFIKALKRMGYKLELWLCNDYDLSFEEERRLGNTRAGEEKFLPVFCKEAEEDEHFKRPFLLDKFTKPEEAWFKHLEKFVDWGADFFKQDGANQVCTHPDRLWRGNGMRDEEMHNLYPLLYSRQMNEGFVNHTNRRALVFTVAGWTGFQHYCGTWTGDTGGRIETIGAMLNTSCVGHSWSTNDMEVAQAEGIHFGYLLPWSQINSWTYFRMPWLQGKELLEMHQYYARLRSRLTAYIYSNAYASTQSGMPLLMPLVIEYPQDRACRTILHEYLLGSSLLVTAYKHDIYLPEGTWLDFWTNKEYEGSTHLEDFQWPANRGGGLFLRSGAIIPLTEVMSYTDEKTADELELLIYPGCSEHSQFTLYEDDGITFNYRRNEFALSEFALDRTAEGWTLSVRPSEKTAVKKYSAVLCGVPAAAKVVNNTQTVSSEYNAGDRTLKISGIEAGELKIIL